MKTPNPKQVKMNDLKPFEHGQEGTHFACQERSEELGGKVTCCGCIGHKCKEPKKVECEFCVPHKFEPNYYVDICKCGHSLSTHTSTQPQEPKGNITEKQNSVTQKETIYNNDTKDWIKEFRENFVQEKHWREQTSEIAYVVPYVHTTAQNLEQFISSQIQQAEERLVEKIKKEYNKRYQKIAKEHGLKRKTPHTMFHDVLATLKEEKDL